MSRILPGNIEVLVTSFGGVGTTFLTRFVSRYKTTNHSGDADLLKHLAVPPCSFNSGVRFVYVYGDPIMAVVSLFRRNYQYVHSGKLQSYQKLVVSPIPKEMSLEQYALSGRDQFLFESHFDNWYRRYLLHPTVFIRYEKLWDNLEPLFDFLGIPASAISAFPEKKERESSLSGISPEALHGLQMMYGGFKKRLDGLKDFEVRAGNQPCSRSRIVFSKNMRAVMIAQNQRRLANYLYDHYPRLHQQVKRVVETWQKP